MEKIYKSVKITVNTHKEAKKFCDKRNLKLNLWIDSLIVDKLTSEKSNDNLQNNK